MRTQISQINADDADKKEICEICGHLRNLCQMGRILDPRNPAVAVAAYRHPAGRPGMAVRLVLGLVIVPLSLQAAPPPPTSGAAPAPASPAGPAAVPSTPPPSAPPSRIEKFYYLHYKEGEEKPVALVQGEWAVLHGQDQVDLIQPTFTLYHTVENRQDKLVLRAVTGLFNKKAHHASLEGDVIAQQEDGAELRTERADVDLTQKRLTTDRRVEVRKPGLNLTGVGMEATKLLKVLTLHSMVTMSVRGGAAGLLGGAGRTDKGAERGAGETSVTSDGPCTMTRLATPRPDTGATDELRFARNVAVTRHDAAGMTQLKGDAATIDLFYQSASPTPGSPTPAGPAPAAGEPEPRRAILTGNVQIIETQGLSGTAHRLDWTAKDDRLELTGDSGVRVARGAFSLLAKRVVILRPAASIQCRDQAEMTFIPESNDALPSNKPAASTPWVVRSDALDIRFQADLKGLDQVEAAGTVTIAGEGKGATSTRQTAAGDRFVWNGSARQGVLTGAPATMRQGDHRMEAVRILLYLLDQQVVLQGPKWVELAGTPSPAGAPNPDGGPASKTPPPAPPPSAAASPAATPPKAEGGMALTARGDIAVDTDGGAVEVGHGAIVVTTQMRLEADRLKVLMAPGGGGLDRALGWGHIRVADVQQGTMIYGDSMAWEARNQEILVEGSPFAYIVQKGGRLQGQAITITRQPDGLRCANRSGTKGRIHVGSAEAKAKP
jgi:LPS export ABC transporter protein LptC